MPQRQRKRAAATPAVTPSQSASETDRLRAIFWEIICLTGRNEDQASPPSEHEPDIPEWALAAVAAMRAEYEEYNGVQGIDLAPDAGPDEICTCGQRITWYHGAWTHIFNPALGVRPNHHRSASPGRGYYEPPETPDEADDPEDEEIQSFDIPVPPIQLREDDRPSSEDLAQLRRNLQQAQVYTGIPQQGIEFRTITEGYTVQPIPPRISVGDNPHTYELHDEELTLRRREPIEEGDDTEDATFQPQVFRRVRPDGSERRA